MNFRSVQKWVLLFLLAAVGLYGRYDFYTEPGIRASWRAIVVSWVSLLLWMPLIYVSLQAFLPSAKKIVCTAFFVVSIFPWGWLGYGVSPSLRWMGRIPDTSSAKPNLQWLPAAFNDYPLIPNEAFLFGLLLVAGWVFIQIYFTEKKWARVIWFLILVQGFLHLSLHSPYSYLPHFENSAAANHWYHTHLFPEQRGAVNEDGYWFWFSETLYLGNPGTLSLFWGRLLPHFLSSRFTVFFHPLHVWIALNTLTWFLSVMALRYLGRWLFSKRVGDIAGVIALSSPGLIVYFAQAKPYAFAFSFIAIFLALWVKLLVEQTPSFWRSVFMGLVLGILLLSYEFQPWLLVIPILGRLHRLNYRYLLVLLGVGIGIWVGFGAVVRHLPGIDVHPTFQGGYGNPTENLLHILFSGDVNLILSILSEALIAWGKLSFHAFSTVLPFAILSLFYLKRRNVHSMTPLVFIAPALIACLSLSFTQQTLYFQFGRTVFGAYVGIYLLAALSLAALIEKQKKWGFSISVVLLFANFIHWNLDVWGHPCIYFHWFYGNPGFAP